MLRVAREEVHRVREKNGVTGLSEVGWCLFVLVRVGRLSCSGLCGCGLILGTDAVPGGIL